jgi:hypothetical protein
MRCIGTECFKGAAKLKTFTVIAVIADRIDVTTSQGRKICHHRTGSASLTTRSHHLIGGKSRFHGWFVESGITIVIRVQKEISDDDDTKVTCPGKQVAQARKWQCLA